MDEVPVEDHPVRPAHPLDAPGQTPSAFNDMTCFPHIANIPNAMIYLEIYRNICRTKIRGDTLDFFIKVCRIPLSDPEHVTVAVVEHVSECLTLV